VSLEDEAIEKKKKKKKKKSFVSKMALIPRKILVLGYAALL